MSAKFALPMPMGVDRRVARTHMALHQSLFSLMGEKDYDSITVHDILERADVGRSTFYTHFSSKDVLLKNGLGMFQAWLTQAQEEAKALPGRPDGPLQFTLPLFEHVHEQRGLYRMLVGRPRGAILVHRELHRILTEVVRRDLNSAFSRRSADTEINEAIVALVSGALYQVMTWWLGRSSSVTPEGINRIFRGFVLPGLIATFPGRR